MPYPFSVVLMRGVGCGDWVDGFDRLVVGSAFIGHVMTQ